MSPEANKWGGISASIYFTDDHLFRRIEGVAKACQVSTSRVIESVLAAAIEQVERKAPVDRVFKIEASVTL